MNDFPTFQARAPWLGGDLQTLRNVMVRRPEGLSFWPARRLELALRDGSGDRLSAALHRPREDRARPHVVLIHGLTGCEESSYIRASANHLLEQGYPVLRLNLRGAGPSRPLCRFQYNAGSSADLRDALLSLQALNRDLTNQDLLFVGYSLGANMMLKFLAEFAAAFNVVAAASVSAPIDLKAAQRRIMAPRNALYHRYLLARMKRDALAGPAEPGDGLRRTVSAARTVYAFDDSVVAPAAGFSGADDYYRNCSALRFMPAVEVPTLVIHSLDDPWIPAEAYRGFDWHAAPRLIPLLPASGGHVGFHGADSMVAWHDRCIAQFFEGLLSR